MDNDLENIKNLIIKIVELNKKNYTLKHDNQYICENYDTYKTEYYKTRTELVDTRKLFTKKCNEYINYPKEKFLFINRTKKIKFKEEDFIGLVLDVPYIDKKEYYCLINLFEHMSDYMTNWGYHKTSWTFK